MPARPTFLLLLRQAPAFRWLVVGAVIATVLVILFPPRFGSGPPTVGPGSFASPGAGPQATLPPPPPIPTGPVGAGSRPVIPPKAAVPPKPVPPVAKLPGVPVSAPPPSYVPANREGVLPSAAAPPPSPPAEEGAGRLTTPEGRPLAPADHPSLVPSKPAS